jgi:hypothetical protein
MTARQFLHGSIAGLVALAWSQAAVAAKKLPTFPGTYVNEIGIVIIKKTHHGFAVDISTAEPRGKWACDFSEPGKLDDDGDIVIQYKPEAGTDTLKDEVTISLRKNTLTVSGFRGEDATGIVDLCGYNGRIEGDYRRKVKR